MGQKWYVWTLCPDMTGKNNGIFAFGHDVQTVTDNLTFYTSTAKRNGGIKVNGLTDYQNRQLDKMLKFLRGIVCRRKKSRR